MEEEIKTTSTNDILNSFDINNKKITNYDDLFYYYIKIYKIDYIYFCFKNQQFLNDEIILYLSRYTKYFILNYKKDNLIFEKKVNHIKFYIDFIIKNYFEEKVILQNENCLQLLKYQNNINRDLNSDLNNDLNNDNKSFYDFIEKLLFLDDKIKPISEIEFYRLLFNYLQKFITYNLTRIKIIKFMFHQKKNLLFTIIKTNYKQLWFNDKNIEKTIFGDLFNNHLSIFNTYKYELINILFSLLKKKEIKIYIRNWFINVYNLNKQKMNSISITNFKDTNINLLFNINSVLISIVMNAGKKLTNIAFNFSLINNPNCLLDLYKSDRLFFKFHESIKEKQLATNKDYDVNKYSFLEYLIYLSIGFSNISYVYLIDNLKKIKLRKISITKSLNEIKNRTYANETISEKYLRKSLIALQQKTIQNLEISILKQIDILKLSFTPKFADFINYNLKLIITIFKENNEETIQSMPVFFIEYLITILNNKQFFDKLSKTIDYPKLLEFDSYLLLSEYINPHLKSKIISHIYLYCNEINNVFYWMNEDDLSKFILNFYNLYVKFHKMVNTWNYYEKMYIKIDILYILLNLSIYDNEYKINYNNSNLTEFVYILLEDLIQINDIIFNYFKSIEEDENLKNYNQKYIISLLKNNSMHYDLIELILEILQKLVTKLHFSDFQKIFLNNKHILENLSLSLCYTIFKNYNLSRWFPKLFGKYLLQENKNWEHIFNPTINILTNYNFIMNQDFLKFIINNKYFEENSICKLIENKNIISSQSLNNFAIFIKNINEIKLTIKSETDIEYPDEFYDPIMDCLIENPVILPNSNVIMEKYVVEKHLLTSNLDPFTRDKLTIDILIKHNEKQEIIDKLNKFKKKRENFKKKMLS